MTDEEIGRKVRESVVAMDAQEDVAGMCYMAGQFLALTAHRANSEITTIEIDKMTYLGKPVGSWRVTVERIDHA